MYLELITSQLSYLELILVVCTYFKDNVPKIFYDSSGPTDTIYMKPAIYPTVQLTTSGPWLILTAN